MYLTITGLQNAKNNLNALSTISGLKMSKFEKAVALGKSFFLNLMLSVIPENVLSCPPKSEALYKDFNCYKKLKNILGQELLM